MNRLCEADPEMWVGEHSDLRDEAAEACGHCPALAWCTREAERIKPTWGVWAGKDYSPTVRPKLVGCARPGCTVAFEPARNGRVKRFCSLQCAGIVKRKPEGVTQSKPCLHCGESFERKASLTNPQWERQRFCSPRCGARATAARKAAAA